MVLPESCGQPKFTWHCARANNPGRIDDYHCFLGAVGFTVDLIILFFELSEQFGRIKSVTNFA